MRAFLYVVWLTFLAWELRIMSVEIASFSRACGQIEDRTMTLERKRLELSELGGQAGALSREAEYMRNLLNLIPNAKGNKTLQVLLDEVQTLRKEMRKILRGRLFLAVDTKTNKLYLKRGLVTLWSADCSVGRGGTLLDRYTGRRWEFVTPRGEFKIREKIRNPVWIKPDWAFVESGEPLPPPDSPLRKVAGELGNYVLSLGDGYLIHGTKDETALGRAVSHGCVRLGSRDLEKLYQTVPMGTKVYIY